MLHKTAIALTGLALVSCSTVHVQSPVRIKPLEIESVFPITGGDCACSFFEAGPTLSFEQVLLSTTSTDARAMVSGSVRTLHQIARTEAGDRWINTYGVDDTRITVESTEVPFTDSCAHYPNPPSDGSCFVGELHVVSGGISQSVPVVGVCGC
jgi:hypothetical protein